MEENLRKRIKIKLIDKNMNITDLAKSIGIGQATLYRKLNNIDSFKLKEIVDILSILDCSFEELFK